MRFQRVIGVSRFPKPKQGWYAQRGGQCVIKGDCAIALQVDAFRSDIAPPCYRFGGNCNGPRQRAFTFDWHLIFPYRLERSAGGRACSGVGPASKSSSRSSLAKAKRASRSMPIQGWAFKPPQRGRLGFPSVKRPGTLPSITTVLEIVTHTLSRRSLGC
jgi:hypothetical protein